MTVNSGGLYRRDRVRHRFGRERRSGRFNLDANEVACDRNGQMLHHAYQGLFAERDGDERINGDCKLDKEIKAARRCVDDLSDLLELSAAFPPSDYYRN